MDENFHLHHQQAASLPLQSNTRGAARSTGSFFSQLPPLPPSLPLPLAPDPPPPPPPPHLPLPPKMFPDSLSLHHDSNKRPINAFVLWASPRRRELARRYPTRQNAVLTQVLYSEWQRMSLEAKQPYIEAARRFREQQRRVKQLQRPKVQAFSRYPPSLNYTPAFPPRVALQDTIITDVMAVPNNHIVAENGIIPSPIGMDQMLHSPQELQALQFQYSPSVNALPGAGLQNPIGASMPNPSAVGLPLFSPPPPPHHGGAHHHMVGSQHLAVNNFVLPSAPAAPRPLPFAPSLPNPAATMPMVPPHPLPPSLPQHQLIGNRGPLHCPGIFPAMQQRQQPGQVFGGGQPGSLPRIVLPPESLDNPNSPLQPLLKHAVFPPQDVVPRPRSLLIDGSSLRTSRDMRNCMPKSESSEHIVPIDAARDDETNSLLSNWERDFIGTEQPRSPIHRPSSNPTSNSVQGLVPKPPSAKQNSIPGPEQHSKIRTSVSRNSSPRPQSSVSQLSRCNERTSSKPQAPNSPNSVLCSSSKQKASGFSTTSPRPETSIQKPSHRSSPKPDLISEQGSVPSSTQRSSPKLSTTVHRSIPNSVPGSSPKPHETEHCRDPKSIHLEASTTALSSNSRHPSRHRFISQTSSSSRHRTVPVKIGSVQVNLLKQDLPKKLTLRPSQRLIAKSRRDIPPPLLASRNQPGSHKNGPERRPDRELPLPSNVRKENPNCELSLLSDHHKKEKSAKDLNRMQYFQSEVTSANGDHVTARPHPSPRTPPSQQQASPIMIADSPLSSHSNSVQHKSTPQPPPLFRDRPTHKALPTPSRRVTRPIPKPPPLYSDYPQ